MLCKAAQTIWSSAKDLFCLAVEIIGDHCPQLLSFKQC